MKNLCPILIAIAASFSCSVVAHGDTTLISDDFSSYPTGAVNADPSSPWIVQEESSDEPWEYSTTYTQAPGDEDLTAGNSLFANTGPYEISRSFSPQDSGILTLTLTQSYVAGGNNLSAFAVDLTNSAGDGYAFVWNDTAYADIGVVTPTSFTALTGITDQPDSDNDVNSVTITWNLETGLLTADFSNANGSSSMSVTDATYDSADTLSLVSQNDGVKLETFDNVNLSTTAPEPNVLALVSLGLGALLVLYRVRNRASA